MPLTRSRNPARQNYPEVIGYQLTSDCGLIVGREVTIIGIVTAMRRGRCFRHLQPRGE